MSTTSQGKSKSGSIGLALGLVALALVAVYAARRSSAPETPAPLSVATSPAPPTASPSSASSGDSARTAVSDRPAGEPPRSAVVSAPSGWVAAGTVRAAVGSAGVAGARVDLWLRLADGTGAHLARATSSADGAFTAALEPLAAIDRALLAHARVAARIEAPGYQPAEVAVPLPEPGPTRVELHARLVDGAAVRGRAVGRDGRAAGRATAALSIADGRSGPGGLTLLAEAEADDEGHFALGFAAGGRLFLSVRADGVGTFAREIEVEARRDRDVGDVELAGGAPIAGVALHVDGTPAQSLELWALEGETSFKPDGFAIAVRRAREVERGEGLSWSRTYTDAEGRFEFRALRPDHYALKAADPAIVVEPRQGRWEPGQTNVQLQVQTPLLVVRVVDASGAPAQSALVEVTELGLEADGTFTPGSTRRAVARGPSAAATFSADPETPLAVSARLRAHAAPEKIVFFGQGTLHLEETLVLAPRARGGALRFRVTGADTAELGLRVSLASPTTGLRDEDLGLLEADEQGLVAGVPPGEHRLHVDFVGAAGAWYFPWESQAAVKIAADGETIVAIEPVQGARLAIQCALSGPPPAGYEGAASQRERYGARIVLAPADAAPGSGAERTLDLRLGSEDVYQLLPGETAECRDLLPPGDWNLRVEGAHWMSTQTRIRLVAGRRLSAAVDVRAR